MSECVCCASIGQFLITRLRCCIGIHVLPQLLQITVTCGTVCSETELRLLLDVVLLVMMSPRPHSNSDTERALSGSSLVRLLGKGGPSLAWDTLRRVTLSAEGFSRGSLAGLAPMVKGPTEVRANVVACSINAPGECGLHFHGVNKGLKTLVYYGYTVSNTSCQMWTSCSCFQA